MARVHHRDIGYVLVLIGSIIGTAGLLSGNKPATQIGAVTGTTGVVLVVHDAFCHTYCEKVPFCAPCPHE